VYISIGCWVAEIYCIWNSIAYSKFNCIKIVAKCLVEFHYTITYFIEQTFGNRTSVGNIPKVVWIARLVLHDVYIVTSEAVAAEIFCKLNFFLQHHHELTCFGMACEELISALNAIHAFPAATCMRLHVSRKSYVFENTIPVEWKFQIAE
jgi:hypothetical protein